MKKRPVHPVTHQRPESARTGGVNVVGGPHWTFCDNPTLTPDQAKRLLEDLDSVPGVSRAEGIDRKAR